MDKDRIDELKLRLELLKENFEYQDFFKKFVEMEKAAPKGNWPGLRFNDFGLTGIRFYIAHPFYKREKIMALVNPATNIAEMPQKYINLLPRLFYEPSVSAVDIGSFSPAEMPDGGRCVSGKEIRLKSSERLFKVDLSQNRMKIEKDFRDYIKATLSANEGMEDGSRKRAEGWRHLKVWRMRIEKKRFAEIARALSSPSDKFTEDAAKQSFYRAAELTQRKKYDPKILKREIVKDDLKKTCNTCSLRKTCKTICPDVLRYIEQDNAKLIEKELDDPSGAKADFLFQQAKKGLSSRKKDSLWKPKNMNRE